jgi:hypothetical protein
MKGLSYILFFCLLFPAIAAAQDSLLIKGQLSSWLLYNGGNNLPVYVGGRYIPQLNYGFQLKNDHKIDFEASLNITGNIGFHPFDSASSSGKIGAYRLWARYSSRQFEIRAGLQKINFGSASILRPLMWFDQVDPRDPLKFTDGVWSVLGRYYFMNNTNIWLWGLYGNPKPRGWELAGTSNSYPEAGGRIQVPVGKGEAAVTFHHRIADTQDLGDIMPQYDNVPENKLGFDIKMDVGPGVWFEGSWVKKNKNVGIYTNQELFNLGTDYTFNAGNGLYVIFEQLYASYDEKPFEFQNSTTLSLLSLSYPLGISDNISGIVYYDWKNNAIYNFLNWQKQFKNITLYLMAFWNPEDYRTPAQGEGESLYAGKGIQVMLVYNH